MEPIKIIENIFISIAVMLCIFPILTVMLGLGGIILHWTIYAVIFVAILHLCVKLNIFKSKKDKHYFLIAILFGAILSSVFIFGSFQYAWLEDDDSYVHASGAKYVAEQYTYSTDFNPDPDNFRRTYLSPYPPSYDVFMGLMYQMFQHKMPISWILKVFNSILCGLAIIFFYMFSKEFFNNTDKKDNTDNTQKAIFATFIITCIPCFMSHFIWSQTLAIIVMIIILYFFERKNYLLAGTGVASLFVTQPSTAAIFTALFAIMWIVDSMFKKKVQYEHIIVGFSGLVMAIIIYWIPTLIKYGWEITMIGIGFSKGLFTSDTVDTSAGIVYSLMDFMVAPAVDKIDQPISFGIFIFFLLIFGIFMLVKNYKQLNREHYIMLAWFIFCMIMVEGNLLPGKLFPHRFWAFLAIPVALIVAESINIILNSFNRKKIIPAISIACISLLLFTGIIYTSAMPKINIQISIWSPGANFMSHEEIDGYLWMQDNLPKDSMVFNICRDEDKVIAFNMDAPIFDLQINAFRQTSNSMSPPVLFENIIYLTEIHNFEYIIVDATCSKYISNEVYPELMGLLSMQYDLHYRTENNHFVMFRNKNLKV